MPVYRNGKPLQDSGMNTGQSALSTFNKLIKINIEQLIYYTNIQKTFFTSMLAYHSSKPQTVASLLVGGNPHPRTVNRTLIH
jgi:hypothetical protein